MHRSALLLLAVVAGACSSTRYVQRDSCWLKLTEGFGQGYREELVMCPSKAPVWSEDRVTRAMQECIAERENAYNHEVIRAERKGEAGPARDRVDAEIEGCRAEAVRLAQAENEKLAALLKAGAEELDRERSQGDKLTGALADAAKKPANATATANADGKAQSGSDSGSAAHQPAMMAAAPERIVVPYRPIVTASTPKKKKPAAAPKAACECPAPDTTQAKAQPVSCETPAPAPAEP